MFLKFTGASLGIFATPMWRGHGVSCSCQTLLPYLFLHCIFNNLAPRVCYVTASSLTPGSGKIRDPGNKLASSMPAFLDACVIIYDNYVMVIIYPRWMHNDLQVALVGTKVDLTYTYEVR